MTDRPRSAGARREDLLPTCLLLLLVVVAYVPALGAGFVWDDDSYVTDNVLLRTWDGLARIWLEPQASPQYYPLVFTSFWVEHHLWGGSPVGYHAVNVLLHAANAWLVWRLLARLGIPGAWWAAALFAVHPVQVESVAWITERKNVLSGLFYLVAGSCLIRALGPGTRAEAEAQRRSWYVAGMLAFVAALLSKTVTATLPAAVLLALWYARGRLVRRDWLALAPLLVLGAAAGLGTAWLERNHVGALGAEWNLSLAERVLVAGRAVVFYVGKLVWPTGLSFNYPRWDVVLGWRQALYPAAVVLAGALLWLGRGRWGRGPLAAWLFFCGTLFPALGFLDVYPFRYSFVADHFQYLASIGPLALLAGAIATLGAPARRVAAAGAVAAIVVLAALTWHQAGIYRDLETLWRDTLAKNPSSWLAHNNLGNVLYARGDADEAMLRFEETLRLKPDNDKAHHNLGTLLVRRGRVEEGIAHFREALRINPANAGAHNNLGNALAALGRFDEAREQYESALHLDPSYAEAHNNLGNVLFELGHLDEAIASYESALRWDPELAQARTNLDVARRARGEAAASGTRDPR